MESPKKAMVAFPQMSTQRLFIRHAQPADAEPLLHYYQSNRNHLAAWEPAKSKQFYQLDFTRERIVKMQQNFLDDSAVHFLAFTHDGQHLIGVCNFSGIIRGVFQACFLGFSIDQDQQGKGLMREMLTPCVHYMFAQKHLHRIMANHLPHNIRSARLLHQLGFTREGYAKRYLKIAGQWQDHVLRSKINDSVGD